MNRLISIDNLRGIAFIFMVIQHIPYFYDVVHNYETNYSKNIFINYSGKIARYTFIILAGVSLGLFKKKNNKNRIKRSLIILFHALLISIVTYILYPNYWVRFGILHFIATSANSNVTIEFYAQSY